MKEQKLSSVYEVKNERAAALLLNVGTRQLLSPFVGARKSVKDASDEVNVELTKYYQRVKQFERADLIEVVETISRAGRPIKLYQAVAEEFFVSYTLTPLIAYYEKGEKDLNSTLWEAISDVLYSRSDVRKPWGVRFYKDELMGMSMTGAKSKGVPRTLFAENDPILLLFWRTLSLSHEKARALQKELHEVLERYTQEQQDGADNYLMRIAMAPLHEQGEG